VHHEADPVDAGDALGRHERILHELRRDLESVAARLERVEPILCERLKEGHRVAQRRADRRPGVPLADLLHDRVLLRCEQDSIEHAGAAQQRDHLVHDRRLRLLDLEVDPVLGERLQHLGQPGNLHAAAPEREALPRIGREPVSGVELLDLGPAALANRPRLVGGSLHVGVVEEHELSIGGSVAVRLEKRHSVSRGALEGGQRVLGALSAGASMTEKVRGGRVEVGVHTHSLEAR